MLKVFGCSFYEATLPAHRRSWILEIRCVYFRSIRLVSRDMFCIIYTLEKILFPDMWLFYEEKFPFTASISAHNPPAPILPTLVLFQALMTNTPPTQDTNLTPSKAIVSSTNIFDPSIATEPNPPLRQSLRTKKPPSYLKDHHSNHIQCPTCVNLQISLIKFQFLSEALKLSSKSLLGLVYHLRTYYLQRRN